MKKIYLLHILLLTFSYGWTQSMSIPLNNYYKIKLLETSGKKVSETLFPANEGQIKLSAALIDSSVQYSDFGYWFFKKDWVEFKKDKIQLSIDPLIDFSVGRSLTQSKKEKGLLFRNTRGIFVRGAIGKRFSFLFSFAENQARFMDYQNQYFNQSGEYYVSANGYDKVNAVIPAGSRTKPFKTDAYDYAYSIGMIYFQATKKLRFEIGNQPNFIGSGYRSLLLSDHSINAFGLRTTYQFNPKWSYQWLLKNNKNLYRKPHTNYVESPYENKLYSALYLTYKPIENLSISLFSASNALRGDSLTKHHLQWQSVIPLPLLNTDLLIPNKIINGITGINLEWAFKSVRLYGQIALDQVNHKTLIAGQLGTYYFNAFNVKNWWLQFESNLIPNNFYTNKYDKLSYTHAQLPLAHPKGNNIGELIFRSQYELNRFYLSFTGILYQNLQRVPLNSLDANSIILQNRILENQEYKYTTHLETIEFGWRYNNKYNGYFYINYINRSVLGGNIIDNQQAVMIGWKVGLFNQYFDF